METQKMTLTGIRPMTVEASYAETKTQSEETHFDAHTHPDCEIYVCLSGDVAFMVENRVYPITRGSVILTRPSEFHHCIYHSFSVPHRHFCIQFSADGNEHLLGRFFARPLGTENLIRLGADAMGEMETLCRELLSEGLSELGRYSAFLRLLAILDEGGIGEEESEAFLPSDVRFALDYIQERLSSPISVSEIADAAHVSINTLERHFLSAMKVTPSAFLKERRLACAETLLRSGRSVMEACEESGFSDYSHFIALFRRRFGVTPLQYKKRRRQ